MPCGDFDHAALVTVSLDCPAVRRIYPQRGDFRALAQPESPFRPVKPGQNADLFNEVQRRKMGVHVLLNVLL
jgi:hypothetical protein